MLRMYVLCVCMFLSVSEGWSARAEDIFSKFQQNDYKLKFEFGETVRYNKQEFKYFSFIVAKYNRTSTVGNFTFEFNSDIGNNLEFIMQAYKFASNEYRLFPMRFQAGYCLSVSKNLMGAASFLKCGNFTGCPVKKGIRYHVCNSVPDENKFPPFIPTGRYMFEFQGLYKSTELFLLRYYYTLYRPVPWE